MKSELLLRKAIAARRARIAVVGLGYVGLPLALEFSRRGFKVLGAETDPDRLKRLLRCDSYITDIKSSALRSAKRSGRLQFTGNLAILRECDVIIICVPTPLKKKTQPDISFIRRAVIGVSRNLKPGSLVVLESTTYPGTTEEVILPLLGSSGRVHGRDFFLSFSPERIDPGNKDFPVAKIPKVVGGVSPEATDLACLLYSSIVAKVVPVSSARVAEAVKLLENTFRLVNIGLIDEMAMMCHKMGIDIWEVIAAAKTKPFGFMPFYPGPGVGGHCIPKDPLYLYWKAKRFGFRSRYIKLASEVINGMPGYCVSRVEEELSRRKISLDKASILVVGVTYKKDVLDLRKSPALDILRILKEKARSVSFYDPLIPFLRLPGLEMKGARLTPSLIRKQDCLIIAADHAGVDYRLIRKEAQLVFDTRNVFQGESCGRIKKL